MDKSTLRQYLELFWVIIKKQGSVAGLLQHFSICNTTFVNDLKQVRKIAGLYGVEIERKKELLSCKIVDEQRIHTLYPIILNYYNNNIEELMMDIHRVEYIIKRILLAKERVDFDIIAHELDYSRSNLRSSITAARRHLQHFSLRLSASGNGLSIQGMEYDKRFCLLSFAIRHNSDILLKDDRDYQRFCENRKMRYSYRPVLNKVWAENGFRCHYGAREVCTEYFLIQKQRMESGDFLSLEYFDFIMDYLLKSREFKAATDFFRLNSLPENKAEIASMALLFIAMEDYEYRLERHDVSDVPQFVFGNMKMLYERMQKILSERWCMDIIEHSQQIMLEAGCLRISVLSAIRLLKYREIEIVDNGKPYKYHPIVANITNELLADACIAMNQPIHYTQGFYLARAVNYMLMSAEFPLYRKKVAFCLMMNPSVRQPYEENIKKYLGENSFGSIDFLSVDELAEKHREYDLIIIDDAYFIGSENIVIDDRFVNIAEGTNLMHFDRVAERFIDTVDVSGISPDNLKILEVNNSGKTDLSKEIYSVLKQAGANISEQQLAESFIDLPLITLLSEEEVNDLYVIKLKKKAEFKGIKTDTIFMPHYKADILRNRYYDTLMLKLLVEERTEEIRGEDLSIDKLNTIVFSPRKFRY